MSGPRGRLLLVVLGIIAAIVVRPAGAADVGNPHGDLKIECATCHSAEGWRPARISPVFDHSKYGPRLEGAHASLKCGSCHKALDFKQAGSACADCHQDPHAGELGVKCARCHTTRSFTERSVMEKEHALTRLPLNGAHLTLDCESCHRTGQDGRLDFSGLGTACADCHRTTYDATEHPAHRSAGFSTDCATCHNTSQWAGAPFDHNRTHFPLTGAHVVAPCAACHGDGVFTGKPVECESCHRTDYQQTTDPNHSQAGYPLACATCHNTARWEDSQFNHDLTRFPLSGAHATAACVDCHGDGVYRNKTTECAGCHQPDYDGTDNPPHAAAGFGTDCASCHNTGQWKGAVFDHGTTDFPLTGGHVGADCASCHGDRIFNGKSTDCATCHRTDYDATTNPNHAQAGYPLDCAHCHDTVQWANGTFNHETTGFPLTGAHGTIQCAGCHGDGIFAGKPADCASCHRTVYDATLDPAHAAAGFGTDCSGCHTTSQWAGAPYDHAAMTGFALTGAHAAIDCAGCHGDAVFQGRTSECVDCHRTDYDASTSPDHAQAGYPLDCAGCHDTVRWANGTFDHDNQTSFPLTGAHRAADCAGCHGDGVFNGQATDCYACHKPRYDQTADPPHAAAGFGTDCAGCHTTIQWAGAPFDHETGTSFALTGAHRNQECASCHGDGVFDGRSTECASCHRPKYDETIDPPHAAAGFATDCAGCHTTTQWAGAPFDHAARTSFPLTGAHGAVDCQSCHGDNIFDGKPTDCAACHRGDYDQTTAPNHPQAGYPLDCAKCHGTGGWTGASFDHNSRTSFPLTGAHIGPACAACHGDGVFDGRSTDCASCHQPDYNQTSDPPHAAAGFSTNCATCHGTARWSDAVFNHDTQTSFPLTGAHAAADCAGCHGDAVYDGKPTDCASCHRPKYDQTTDPPHAAAGFGTDCATCHGTARWDDAVFNHDTQTSFPLTGRHAGVNCASCHGDGIYGGRSSDCQTCHQADYDATTDPNHAQAGYPSDCATCHDTGGWEGGRFDHDTQTNFPLTGAHVAATCASCHGDGVYDGKPTDCASCHRPKYDATDDPPHAAAGFGPDCASCHNTTRWEDAVFNHDTQTSFPLTGAHVPLDCASCHGDGVFAGKPTDCNSCHHDDYTATTTPPHQASGYGTNCATCHNTTRWEDATFNHNNTSFPLTGAHVAAACATCHGDGVYDGKPTDCWSCHQSQFTASTNPHHGPAGFSHDCRTCHNTTSWDGGSYNHTTQTSFPLTGRHLQVDCASCHGDQVYNGKATDCNSCHHDDYTATTDPPHQASGFPTTCATCHSTTRWEDATFNHNNTSFPLTGAHVAAACATCHGDGVYDGKPTDCWSCHQSRFTASTNPHHGPAGFSHLCQNCHTTTAWDGGTYNHTTQTSFPLTGRHLQVDCASCHGDQVYNGKATDCNSCHHDDYTATTDPPHQASGFPTTCATCHNTTRWEDASFNHNSTSFPLTGAHVAAACATCHGDGVYDGKPTDCWSCHQSRFTASTNPHHGPAGFSHLCQNCHTTTAWDGGTYNHTTQTSFPLTGAHVPLECASCHGDQVYNGKSTDCYACHQADYTGTTTPPHQASGYGTNCASCHSTTRWEDATFNHNNTSFPLTGAHVAATCASCHGDGVYDGKPTDCWSCHQSRFTASTNPHHGPAGFSHLCQNCHTTTAWDGGTYNHTTQTSFPLTGAHVPLDCASCHGDAVYNGKSTDCKTCHLSDYQTAIDPNHVAAGFPQTCASCHSTTAWSPATFNHDSAYFPIYSGKHRGKWSTCSTCHTNSGDYSVFTCLTCHPHSDKTKTDGDHRGRSGYSYTSTACYSCHPRGNS